MNPRRFQARPSLPSLARPASVCAALFLCAVVASAQAPVAVVDGGVWDFGELDQGAVASHSVKISNSGDAPLEFSRLNTSCGCLEPTLSTKVVAPGEFATLKLDLTTERSFGPLRYTILIGTNVPGAEPLVVEAHGKVNAPWWPSVSDIDLGRIDRGQVAEARFEILLGKGSETRLKRVLSNVSWLTVKTEALPEVSGKRGWSVVLRLGKNAPIGPLGVGLLVETDDERVSAHEVMVRGEVVGELVVSPRRIRFGGIVRGRASLQRIVITSSKRDFRVLDVTSTDDRVVLDIESTGKREVVIAVSVKNPGETGRLLARVTVTTDVPGQEKILVSCVGRFVR